jgi:hypothetical protein
MIKKREDCEAQESISAETGDIDFFEKKIKRETKTHVKKKREEQKWKRIMCRLVRAGGGNRTGARRREGSKE